MISVFPFFSGHVTKIPLVIVFCITKHELSPVSLVCNVQTGIPVLKADDGRDAGREAIATCHHVCGIAQREDAISGDAFAQIVCCEPDFCIGGAVGKGFGGPTGVAFEAGEINGSANDRLDAGGIEVYRVLHTEGRPPGTVVAEGGDIGFIRLGASGRCPIETDVEPDDIARFPLRGVGVWTARVAGRVAPAVYAGRGPMVMLSSRGADVTDAGTGSLSVVQLQVSRTRRSTAAVERSLCFISLLRFNVNGWVI